MILLREVSPNLSLTLPRRSGTHAQRQQILNGSSSGGKYKVTAGDVPLSDDAWADE